MKIIKFGIVILLVSLSFSACEKDDICVDADTPLLIVRFYDANDTTIFKPVAGLRIIGLGKDVPVNTFTDRSSDLDSLAIPLKINNTLTGFTFIKDSADDEDGNEAGNSNIVNFSYEVTDEYISRACGFIANYNNLNTEFTTTPENWIQRIKIVKSSIEIEETVTAHVKIFH